MTMHLKCFDRFGELEWIGARGAIQLYTGTQMYRRTEVLLKIVRPPSCAAELGDAVEAQKRLLLEAVATDRVVHPNAVRLIDAGLTRDFESFVALERLKGSSLAEHLINGGRMSLRSALEMAIAIARALCVAHARGVVHANVSPATIFLLENGGCKLAEFGDAFAAGAELLRPNGPPFGTHGYVCPRYAATGVPEERSDLYSLAATLYEAISGFKPVTVGGRIEICEPSLKLRMTVGRSPSPLHELVPHVDRELSLEICRAMSPNPEDRQATVEALLRVLECHCPPCESPLYRGGRADHDSPTVPVGIVAACRRLSLPEDPGESTPARPAPAASRGLPGGPGTRAQRSQHKTSSCRPVDSEPEPFSAFHRELPPLPETPAPAAVPASTRSVVHLDGASGAGQVHPVERGADNTALRASTAWSSLYSSRDHAAPPRRSIHAEDTVYGIPARARTRPPGVDTAFSTGSASNDPQLSIGRATAVWPRMARLLASALIGLRNLFVSRNRWPKPKHGRD